MPALLLGLIFVAGCPDRPADSGPAWQAGFTQPGGLPLAAPAGQWRAAVLVLADARLVPCQTLLESVAALAAELPDAWFVVADVGQDDEFRLPEMPPTTAAVPVDVDAVKRLGIEVLPTVVVFDRATGRELGRVEGTGPDGAAGLGRMLRDWLNPEDSTATEEAG